MFETTLTSPRARELAVTGAWPGRILGDVLREFATQTPDKWAIVDPRRRVSYRELANEVDDFALGLLRLGVRRGDVVSVQLPNWIEFVVAAFALSRIGAVINPITPIFRENELRAIFGLAHPVAVIVPESFRGCDHPSLVARVRSENESIRWVIVVPARPTTVGRATLPPQTARNAADPSAAPDRCSTLNWQDVAELGATSSVPVAALDVFGPDANDVFELIFTSGTTGEPKGVLHTHNTMWAAIAPMIEAQGCADDDVFHMASTFGHQTGFQWGMCQTIQCGATLVLQDVWDASAFIDLVERERITSTSGAAPFLADVLRVPAVEQRDLVSWRRFGCFGAPIPEPMLAEATAKLPCRVMPGWGMTEFGLVTTTRPTDDPAIAATTDGRTLPNMAVRVVDEQGVTCAPGVEGDLQCRGAGGFVGYIQGRAFTESCFSDDGWFHTGDRARMDANGYIRLTGRTKDLVIRGGENVPVKEVEDILLRHPSVRAAVIVGAPDDRLGEIGCAFVVAEAGTTFTLEDARTHLRHAGVTPQFWPERIELLDALPMTASGKVQKFRLRELAAEMQRPAG